MPAASNRYLVLDAIRGLGGLSILLAHATNSAGSTYPWARTGILGVFLTTGYVGIEVFFVLGGYVLADRLGKWDMERVSLGRMLAARCLRVFPTYLIVLFGALALNLLSMPFNHTSLASNLPHGRWGAIGDLTLTHMLVGHTPYLLVSWYLTFDLVIGSLLTAMWWVGGWIWKGHPGDAMLLMGLPLLFLARPTVAWLSPLPFFAYPYLGALVWRCIRAGRAPAGVVAAGLVALILWTKAGASHTEIIAGTTTSALLLLLHHRDQWLSQFMPVRLLRQFGVIGYSLFLVQIPLLSHGMNLAASLFPPGRGNPLFGALCFALAWVALVALTVFVGTVVHWRIETPIDRWRRSILSRPSWGLPRLFPGRGRPGQMAAVDGLAARPSGLDAEVEAESQAGEGAV
jgi:peptidoglycan/LPS O-acetylase OafA/YrhL